jgi:hypothetical protein
MGYVWPEKRLGGDINGVEVLRSCTTGFDSWFFFIKFLPFYGVGMKEIKHDGQILKRHSSLDSLEQNFMTNLV